MTILLQIGDCVEWTSGGHTRTTKRGIVVQLVPAGRQPGIDEYPTGWQFMFDGQARKHDSYLVAVDNRLYWPRVGQLRKVTVDK